jgi:hypothetical protein
VTTIAQTAATEALAGLVERVTFHNPENGFCVLRVKARGQNWPGQLYSCANILACIKAVES